VKRFRGGLVFKAHRRLYPSTLGLRVIKKNTKKRSPPNSVECPVRRVQEGSGEGSEGFRRGCRRVQERVQEGSAGGGRSRTPSNALSGVGPPVRTSPEYSSSWTISSHRRYSRAATAVSVKGPRGRRFLVGEETLYSRAATAVMVSVRSHTVQVPVECPVSCRGVGGSGHGYNSLLKPA